MRKVWLHTVYYADSKLAGAPASTERMFTRLLGLAGQLEEGGVIPENCHKLVGLPKAKRSVQDLVDRGLLVALPDGRYEFPAWVGWNDEADKITERRKADAARKRASRAARSEAPGGQSEINFDVAEDPNPFQTWSRLGPDLVQKGTQTGPTLEKSFPSSGTNRENDSPAEQPERENVRTDTADACPRTSAPIGEERRGKTERTTRAANSRSGTRERETTAAASGSFADGSPIPPEPPTPDHEPAHPGRALALADPPTTAAQPPAFIETHQPSRRTQTHVAPAIFSLIRLHVPVRLPRDVMQQLGEIVQRLVRDPAVERTDVETALAEWANRPGAGPRLLPNLVADAARYRAGTRRGTSKPTQRITAAEDAAADLLRELNL
ncbi:hypothetical protein SEA_LILBEANIE_57 [Gordonia phage Lilbeanie]|uniref:Helix-turn-helix DNA binding domain protein n=1 Tax=Gordonia phage Lilbeanie TaxID=2794947 RepID=A0A7T1NWY0_9CAUD|nr:hypothetical protein J1773_gp57 [Gordonia phage Lilbeanie]QPO17135.1 hypothetical protein SEA_LILBEANIE_57 [Gordonia phage Lilbeanie]